MPIRGEWKFVQPQVGGVNKYQFNGIELNDDFGLNWNMARFRSYDPNIGRWWQVDPLAELFPNSSSYSGMGNNPIAFSDPLGLAPTDPVEPKTPPIELAEDNSEDCCPGWMINGARTLQGAMTLDLVTLDPSDAALPKWLGHAVGWGITGAILYFNEPPTDILTYSPPYIPPISFEGDKPVVGKIPDSEPIKIALGRDIDLMPFSAWVPGMPWYTGWGKNIKNTSQMAATITILGSIPNVTLHFNLTGDTYGRIDQPKVLEHFYKQNSYTSVEFVTIMNNPVLRARTTFYEKQGNTYIKVQPHALPPSLKK